jgi:UDP-perosamine 4-acetyltransferase
MGVKKVVIIGAGGHCRAVIECLKTSGRPIEVIVDLDYSGRSETVMGVPVLGSYEEFAGAPPPGGMELAMAIGDNRKRTAVYGRLLALGFSIPPVVHGTAYVSESASVGDGSFIGAGCIINAMASIGQNAIVNTGAIIEHETVIGPGCHIGPGARIAGRVTVGAGSFLGIGTSVIDCVRIGEDVTVGAGSVVLEDIGSGCTVVGSPARKVR